MDRSKKENEIELPPGLEAHYRHTHRVWSWALCTPVVYLTAVTALEHFGKAPFSPEEPARPLDYPWTTGIVGGLAAALFSALTWHRLRSRAAVVLYSDDPDHALLRWSRMAYAMAIESDCMALLGVIYFLFTGVKAGVLIGGLAAYAGYVVAYPRREDLADLKDVKVEEYL